MRKLIIISILFATVVIPIRAARERSARRGLEKALFAMLVFDVFYLLAVVLVYPRV
jgi:nitrate reductase NapE component